MLDDWIEQGDPDTGQIHLTFLPERNIQPVVPYIFFRREQSATELPVKQYRQFPNAFP